MTHPFLASESAVRAAPRSTKRAQAKLQTRDRVVAAAQELIVERGFEAATMRDIAAAADVSTGAVFASFTDKHELFDAVLASSNEQVAELVRSARDAAAGPATARILAALRASYVFYLERLPLVQACLAQTWSRCETGHAFERYARAPARRILEEMLQAGIDRGEVSGDLDVPLASEFIWDGYLANFRGAVFEGWDLHGMMRRMEAQLERILCGYLRD